MANPSSVRYLNGMRALNALFRAGGMSRSDLARLLGLNRSSVGYIVQELISDGLARELEVSARASNETARDARTGRPGIIVELDASGALFVGLEIGVDHITIVAIDLVAGETLRRSIPYPTARVAAEVCITDAAAMIDDYASSLGEQRRRIRGVCAAVPALVRDGVVVNGFMLGWRGVALGKLLQEKIRLDAPVLIENDANAFAIGETYFESFHQQTGAIAFLLIENGCGGGVVIDGKLMRGGHGFAGEFGQLSLRPNAPPESAKLENIIGKDGLLARYRANGAPAKADFAHLMKAVRAGGAVARRTAEEWGASLAVGLAHITNVLDPRLIILGGAVAPLYESVADQVQAALGDCLLEGFPAPRIGLSRLGVEGAAFGAACLLHQRMFAIDDSLVHAQATVSAQTDVNPGRAIRVGASLIGEVVR